MAIKQIVINIGERLKRLQPKIHLDERDLRFSKLEKQNEKLRQNLKMVSRELHQTRLVMWAYKDLESLRKDPLFKNFLHPINRGFHPKRWTLLKSLQVMASYEDSMLSRRWWNPRNNPHVQKQKEAEKSNAKTT